MPPRSPLLDPEFLKKLEPLGATRGGAPGAGSFSAAEEGPADLELLFSVVFSGRYFAPHLLLDASGSMEHDAGAVKFAYARKLAAATGYASLKYFGDVGVGGFGQARGARGVRLHGDEGAVRLFALLNRLRAGGTKGFAAALRSYVARVPPGAVCLVLSDFLAPHWERGIRALLSRQCDVVLVQILTPEEIRPEFLNDLRLVDAGTGVERRIGVTSEYLARYQEALDTFYEAILSVSQQHHMLYIRTTTADPVEAPLLKTLRARGLLRGEGKA